jgi:DNA-binding IclR family transcriptional regulator
MKTRTVPSLDKALCILELLTQARAGLSLPELVQESGLPKSSIHYLLVTLERRGYVERSERSGRYLLGQKLFTLANSALSGLNLRHCAAPHLSALRMRTGLTAHMAILEQHEAVLIAKQEAPCGFRLASWVGKRMELHCTGLGKALLAYLTPAEIDTIIGEHRLGRHNENTISNPKRLREDLERVIKRGFALDDEEDELGIRCIGMPVFAHDDRPVAAISVAGTTNEISPENLTFLVGELKRSALAVGHAVSESMAAHINTAPVEQVAV